MIEINLVEKKRLDITPYMLVGIFLIGVTMIIVSLFLYQNYLDAKQADLMENKAENRLNVNEINDKKEVIQASETLSSQIDQLNNTIYPTTYLLNQVTAVMPEQASVMGYNFTISEDLQVNIKANSIDETSRFVKAMSDLAFVEKSNLIIMDKKDQMYEVEFTFQVSKDSLLEEAD